MKKFLIVMLILGSFKANAYTIFGNNVQTQLNALSNRMDDVVSSGEPLWLAAEEDVTEGVANGNEAQGWGNHATAGYLQLNDVSDLGSYRATNDAGEVTITLNGTNGFITLDGPDVEINVLESGCKLVLGGDAPGLFYHGGTIAFDLSETTPSISDEIGAVILNLADGVQQLNYADGSFSINLVDKSASFGEVGADSFHVGDAGLFSDGIRDEEGNIILVLDPDSAAIKNVDGTTAIDLVNKTIMDGAGLVSINPATRYLYAEDGTSPALEWASGGDYRVELYPNGAVNETQALGLYSPADDPDMEVLEFGNQGAGGFSGFALTVNRNGGENWVKLETVDMDTLDMVAPVGISLQAPLIGFNADGEQFTVTDGEITPFANNDFDIGTTGSRFKDGYFAGAVYANTVALDTNIVDSSAGRLTVNTANTVAFLGDIGPRLVMRAHIGTEVAIAGASTESELVVFDQDVIDTYSGQHGTSGVYTVGSALAGHVLQVRINLVAFDIYPAITPEGAASYIILTTGSTATVVSGLLNQAGTAAITPYNVLVADAPFNQTNPSGHLETQFAATNGMVFVPQLFFQTYDIDERLPGMDSTLGKWASLYEIWDLGLAQ